MKIRQNKEFIEKKGLAKWMFELEDSARRYITEQKIKPKKPSEFRRASYRISYKKLYYAVIEELEK